MDTLAHALYGAAIVAKNRDEKMMLAAAISGMMPDILVYGTAFAKLGLVKGMDFITNPNPAVLGFNVEIYYYTHSFLVAGLIALGLFLIKKKWVILVVPYFLHILFDIFLHCGLFATRFLYPLTNFNVCGTNYADHWWAWEINYGILIGIFYLIYLKWYKPFIKV